MLTILLPPVWPLVVVIAFALILVAGLVSAQTGKAETADCKDHSSESAGLEPSQTSDRKGDQNRSHSPADFDDLPT